MRRALLLLQTALDDYLDGGLVEAALSDIVGAVGGEATFGALVGGTVVTSFWLAGDGDLATLMSMLKQRYPESWGEVDRGEQAGGVVVNVGDPDEYSVDPDTLEATEVEK